MTDAAKIQTAALPSAAAVLADIWRLAGLSPEVLPRATLTGAEPVLPSSFPVNTAAQASIAAAALAASEVWRERTGQVQTISVDMRDAAAECTGWFSVDGRVPDVWDKISGLYPCGAETAEPGWVRIHANFAHHRDGALKLLGLPAGEATEKADVVRALRRWRANDFAEAAAQANLVVSALRSFAQWDAHPQNAAIAAMPLFSLERIGDAPPRPLPKLDADRKPLAGLRVLDLTRILAGPTCGRTLATYGADVMLVNSPHLPNVEAIIDTSRGKLSAHVDLATEDGRQTLMRLARDAHVFVQGYRPGGLARRGFSPEALAQLNPGIVCVSLSAYGGVGPWAERRGFDSLVQTATGFNHAEGAAFDGEPKALPMQILDYASGFLMAFGAQAALLRQAKEGGSWLVRVSLAQTAHWLRGLGRIDGTQAPRPDFKALLETYDSGYGKLVTFPHAAKFSRTRTDGMRPSMPPGSHAPAWPV
jgi:crotonobetainyl-CoA:carnitine CoA-transferase CaiB-like acyl-CoA transferase